MLEGDDERCLAARFEVGRQVYNAALGEALRRASLMEESRAYQAARCLPRGAARTRAFGDVRTRIGFSENSIRGWAVRTISPSWLSAHLDAQVIEVLVSRAFRAVDRFVVHRKGRPRFKGPNQLDSVEGHSNTQGLRFKAGLIHWRRWVFRLRIEPADGRAQHALHAQIQRVRIVRRRIRGRTRYFAQLICRGRPLVERTPDLDWGRLGIDPGPRFLTVAGERWAARIDLQVPLKSNARKIRRLRRTLERKRQATRRGRSNEYQRELARLTEIYRRAAETRRTLRGRLTNLLVRISRTIHVERTSYKTLQRRYPRSVSVCAPGAVIMDLSRKAENAGGRVMVLPTKLRLSQACHACGAYRAKPLSQRVHECSCGLARVQRDVYSAWLAATAAMFDPKGSIWVLDMGRAKSAWPGAGSRLSSISRTISIQDFSSWVEQAARSAAIRTHPGPGAERLADEAWAMTDEARNDVGSLNRGSVKVRRVSGPGGARASRAIRRSAERLRELEGS